MKNIIIGGTVRSGKTTLANLLRDKFGYSKVESDTIVNAFDKVFPTLGITHKKAEEARINYEPFLFEILNGFRRDLKFTNNITIFPGSQFLPENLAKYDKIEDCIVIFLGFDGISEYDLLKSIRANDSENDWTFKKDDEWLLRLCKNIILESDKLKIDCEKYGFYYFNTYYAREEIFNQICEIVKNINN